MDVVCDKPGRTCKAGGHYVLHVPSRGSVPTVRLDAHALCVGYFNSGNRISVVGEIASSSRTPTTGWLVYEFDVLNKELRAVTKSTLADARTACTQSGVFQSTFNHGFFVAN